MYELPKFFSLRGLEGGVTDGVGFPRHTFLIKVFEMKRQKNALANNSIIYLFICLLLSTLIYIVVLHDQENNETSSRRCYEIYSYEWSDYSF